MNADFSNDRARQYLLGTLPEDERGRMERDVFQEDRRFDDILAAEESLIDDYIHDALDAESRWRFERVLAARARTRSRVDLARATRQAARRVKPAVSPSALRVWLSVAAALVLAVGGLLTSAVTFRDVVTVALSAHMTRSAAGETLVLLHPYANELHVTIDVETDADTVDVVVIGPTGREVDRRRSVPVTGDLPIRHVRIDLRASVLRDGRHDVALTSPSGQQDQIPFAYGSFIVTRR